jgi:hypothetical protein
MRRLDGINVPFNVPLSAACRTVWYGAVRYGALRAVRCVCVHACTHTPSAAGFRDPAAALAPSTPPRSPSHATFAPQLTSMTVPAARTTHLPSPGSFGSCSDPALPLAAACAAPTAAASPPRRLCAEVMVRGDYVLKGVRLGRPAQMALGLAVEVPVLHARLVDLRGSMSNERTYKTARLANLRASPGAVRGARAIAMHESHCKNELLE